MRIGLPPAAVLIFRYLCRALVFSLDRVAWFKSTSVARFRPENSRPLLRVERGSNASYVAIVEHGAVQVRVFQAWECSLRLSPDCRKIIRVALHV